MKLKTIKLTQGQTGFRVEQLTNSVDYRVGQILNRNEVQALCASNRWKVTIAARKGD